MACAGWVSLLPTGGGHQLPFSDPWSPHDRTAPPSLIPPVPSASRCLRHYNSLAAAKLIKSNSFLFYPLISLDGSVSSLVLQKSSHLPHCEISSASPDQELCCGTRFSRLQKESFPCFPTNLLNAGDSTNAFSQQCWQKDRSHLLLPLCQPRCSSERLRRVQQHKGLWHHKRRLPGVAAGRTERDLTLAAPV